MADKTVPMAMNIGSGLPWSNPSRTPSTGTKPSHAHASQLVPLYERDLVLSSRARGRISIFLGAHQLPQRAGGIGGLDSKLGNAIERGILHHNARRDQRLVG